MSEFTSKRTAISVLSAFTSSFGSLSFLTRSLPCSLKGLRRIASNVLLSSAPFFIYRRNNLTSGFQKLSFLNFFPEGFGWLYGAGDLLACICAAFFDMWTCGSSSFSRLLLALWPSESSDSLFVSIGWLIGQSGLAWLASCCASLGTSRYCEKSGRKKSVTFSSWKSNALASTFSNYSSSSLLAEFWSSVSSTTMRLQHR